MTPPISLWKTLNSEFSTSQEMPYLLATDGSVSTGVRQPAHLVDRRGQLTLHGIWALAQAVHGFCEQRRYPLWRFAHENYEEPAIAAWHQAFIEALGPWAEVRLWVEEYAATWGLNTRVHLSAGEISCCRSHQRHPTRHPWTLALNAQQASTVRVSDMNDGEPVRLGDLVQSRHGVDGLIFRLDKKCVAPYEAIDVPPLADEAARNRKLWTWANREVHPVALAWPDLSAFQREQRTPPPVLIPRAWGNVAESWGRLGPLQLQSGNTIIVADEAGLAGVVHLMDMRDALLGDVVGYWVQTCRWPYLDGGWSSAGASGAVFEAAQTLAPDAHGDVVCDLIEAFTDTRLNPEGVKILAGTLTRDGCIAVSEAPDANSPRRVDRVNLAGQLMHGKPAAEAADGPLSWTAANLRWADIQADSENYSPVQCPESGSWGFIDRAGAIAIDPQFAEVGHFQQERARAWPRETPDLLGLIDASGKWAIAPQWRRIDAQTRRCFVVQDAADRWGAVDERGKLMVPLKPREIWRQDPWILQAIDKMRKEDGSPLSPWDRQPKDRENELLIEGIARQWHEHMRLWVQTALNTPPYTLAVLEGVFDADARQRDLEQAGLWGLKVRVEHDKTTGMLQPKAGEEGRIGTCYPVGLSCFDLSVEAPVFGLAIQPAAVIGVPWKDLAVVAPAESCAQNQ